MKIYKRKLLVHIFLYPCVSGDDGTEKVKLDVTVEMSRKLRKMLCKSDNECRVRVVTKVLDVQGGQNIGSAQFHAHAVSTEDGRVNFRQDLASCDRVRESDSVTLILKATFLTRPRSYVFQYNEQDDYVMIHK